MAPDPIAAADISLFESIVLGIIQGLTEFFPVSSDGHLVLGQALFGYETHNLAFDVLLHGGTLGAIVLAFRKEAALLCRHTWNYFPALVSAIVSKKGRSSPKIHSEDFRWTLSIWLTTFVTGLIGLFGEDLFVDSFQSLAATGVGFLVTSLALFAAIIFGRGKRRASQMPYGFAIILGLAQASALFPGISRSGMTIATALCFGLSRKEAGTFSFTAAIPIITLAFLYQLRHLADADLSQWGIMLVGVATSFVVGLLALKGLMAMLQKAQLWPFAVYTFVLSVYLLIFL